MAVMWCIPFSFKFASFTIKKRRVFSDSRRKRGKRRKRKGRGKRGGGRKVKKPPAARRHPFYP